MMMNKMTEMKKEYEWSVYNGLYGVSVVYVLKKNEPKKIAR